MSRKLTWEHYSRPTSQSDKGKIIFFNVHEGSYKLIVGDLLLNVGYNHGVEAVLYYIYIVSFKKRKNN